MSGATVVDRASTEHKTNAKVTQQDAQHMSLIVGIAPVLFSGETVRIGRLDPEEHGPLKDLRRKHGKTHAFRFDSRDGMIASLGVRPDVEPMGEVEEVPVREHLLLLAEAIAHQLRNWVSGSRKILRHFHPLICLGNRDRLLAKALREVGVQSPDTRLDVVAKWSFDLRLLASGDPDEPPSLGLIADVGTSNTIDIPVSELLAKECDLVGCYVGTPGEVDDQMGSSRLRLLGRVKSIENGMLVLDDVRSDAESDCVDAADVFVEARRETLEAVTRTLYPSVAGDALEKLRRIRAPYLSGDGKLEKIRRTINELNRSSLNLKFGDGLSVQFSALLDQSSPQFPRMIETSRPTMLFGASGHDQQTQPDLGIRQNGPCCWGREQRCCNWSARAK